MNKKLYLSNKSIKGLITVFALVLSMVIPPVMGIVNVTYAATDFAITESEWQNALTVSGSNFTTQNGKVVYDYAVTPNRYYRGFNLANQNILTNTEIAANKTFTLGGQVGQVEWNNVNVVVNAGQANVDNYASAVLVKFVPDDESYVTDDTFTVYIQVKPAEVTIKPVAQNIVYGQTLTSANYEMTVSVAEGKGGYMQGEIVNPIYNSPLNVVRPVASNYSVSVVCDENTNYNYTYQNAIFSVLKRDLKVSISGIDNLVAKKDLQNDFNITLDGIQNNDNAITKNWKVIYTYKLDGQVVDSVSKAGKYTLTVTLNDTHAGNYNIVDGVIEFTVAPDLTWVWIGGSAGIVVIAGGIALLIIMLKKKEWNLAIERLSATRKDTASMRQSNILQDLKSGKSTNLSNTTFSKEEIKAEIQRFKREKDTK